MHYPCELTYLILFILLVVSFIVGCVKAEEDRKKKKSYQLVKFYQWFSGLFVTLSSLFLVITNGWLNRNRDPKMVCVFLAICVTSIVVMGVWSPNKTSRTSIKPYATIGFVLGFLYILMAAILLLGFRRHQEPRCHVIRVFTLFISGISLVGPGAAAIGSFK